MSLDEGITEKVREYCPNFFPPSLLFTKDSKVYISNIIVLRSFLQTALYHFLGNQLFCGFSEKHSLNKWKSKGFFSISSAMNFQNKHTSWKYSPITLFTAQIELNVGQFTKSIWSSHFCHSLTMLLYAKNLNSPEQGSSYLKWKSCHHVIQQLHC